MHAGSLAAALASWLDARAHRGRWLIRIEDVDTQRCVPGVDEFILRQLAACGLQSDEPVLYQSRRTEHYEKALQTLVNQGKAYACACSRSDIEQAYLLAGRPKVRHGELVYPGTCRAGLGGRAPRSWRLRTSDTPVIWTDRRLGRQAQNVRLEVGDFVLRRSDGCFAYQLAVVVDDADQNITDIVRGEDLCDNTARQIQLQQALGMATPRYLHTPLVLASDGQKLSKQNGARAIDTRTRHSACQALTQAAKVLGLSGELSPDETPRPKVQWIEAWHQKWCVADKSA